ncbi:helix-turn-helix domain-containing protein [Actinomycetes bacterium KLBMP 9797]
MTVRQPNGDQMSRHRHREDAIVGGKVYHRQQVWGRGAITMGYSYMGAVRQIDRSWWTSGSFEGRPVYQLLAARDIGAVFRFLKTRGWSRAAIAAVTGLTETRVRAVAQGKQQITSYGVLERIAVGLNIERGLLGLAYTAAPEGLTERSGPRPRRHHLLARSTRKRAWATRTWTPSS